MEYDIEDVEFLRHADKPHCARLYRPRGPGPFRMVVELHGGVWSLNDRTHTEPAHRALAEAGSQLPRWTSDKLQMAPIPDPSRMRTTESVGSKPMLICSRAGRSYSACPDNPAADISRC